MHKMVVLAKALPGRKEELGTWYDERHIGDLLTVPGLVSAERHDLMPIKRPDSAPEWDFMLVYEFAGDEPMQVVRAMGGVLAASPEPTSPALESASTLSLVGVSKGKRESAG